MVRVVVFLDGGYISAVLKREGKVANAGRIVPLAIDHEKLSAELVSSDEERIRTYYYTCMPYQSDPPTDEEKERYKRHSRFIYNLKRHSRFEVRLGRLRKMNGEFEQKRVDVLLSVDLVRMSWSKQIERAVIATADSDFVPAIHAAKEAGIITRLAYYPSLPVNNELLEAFDERIEITKALLERCRLKNNSKVNL
jgi:uncharacterized LabA/DUF88 family protein